MAHPNMPEINALASCVGGLTSHELKTRYSLSFENNHTGTDDRIGRFIKSTFEMLESIDLQLQSIDNRLTNVEKTLGSRKTPKLECPII